MAGTFLKKNLSLKSYWERSSCCSGGAEIEVEKPGWKQGPESAPLSPGLARPVQHSGQLHAPPRALRALPSAAGSLIIGSPDSPLQAANTPTRTPNLIQELVLSPLQRPG